MSGSLLAPDQIKKINATFPILVAHLRALLVADHSGVGLMRVHTQVETFDSDEMAKIFREISFISPKEKLALVRAAIYELLAKEPSLFVAPLSGASVVYPGDSHDVLDQSPKVYSPPPFKLNLATSNAAETAKTDTKPTPIVTSTHTPKVAVQLEAGAKEAAEQQARRDAAAEKLRAESAPMIVEPAAEETDEQN